MEEHLLCKPRTKNFVGCTLVGELVSRCKYTWRRSSVSERGSGTGQAGSYGFKSHLFHHFVLGIRLELRGASTNLDSVHHDLKFLKEALIVNEQVLVHKRKLGNRNETLCEGDGAKIYLSSRVTCPKCLELLDE